MSEEEKKKKQKKARDRSLISIRIVLSPSTALLSILWVARVCLI